MVASSRSSAAVQCESVGKIEKKLKKQGMKMKKLLCLVSCFLPAVLFAQGPFDGTWKTNYAESELSQKPYVFSVNSGMFDCESCVPKINNAKADGQDQPVTGQTYDTIAVQVTDANTIHLIGKKAGKTEFEQTRTASQDGKTLTSSITNYPADGSQPFKVEDKFMRLSKGPAGSHATSGSWRMQNVSEEDVGITKLTSKMWGATWKGSGDGLSMSTPTGYGWEAKLDGKENPVKATYDYTVSLKQLGDRSIEATYKRDGKIESVEKITVSPDGKKMTTVVDNKLTGRVATFIAEKAN